MVSGMEDRTAAVRARDSSAFGFSTLSAVDLADTVAAHRNKKACDTKPRPLSKRKLFCFCYWNVKPQALAISPEILKLTDFRLKDIQP